MTEGFKYIKKGYLLIIDINKRSAFNYGMGWRMMFGKKSILSKIQKVFIYGAINFAVVFGLMYFTEFNIQSALQSQLPQILIIIIATGIVNYVMIKKKL